jgi:hypothetical protein
MHWIMRFNNKKIYAFYFRILFFKQYIYVLYINIIYTNKNKIVRIFSYFFIVFTQVFFLPKKKKYKRQF